MYFDAVTPYAYSNAMDREYAANQSSPEFIGGYGSSANLDAPIIGIEEIGQTVTEGRQFGTFLQSMNAALRSGSSKVELQTQMMGSDRNVGAEAYGNEARREIRELAKANQMEITSVHSPTQVGNLSGYTGPERGFNNEQRKAFVEEVRKAIEFAADVEGGAVVVHTGEYARPISEAKWAMDDKGNYMFKGYEEEPEKAIIHIVDNRTGQVLTQVRKNQEVARAVWLKHHGANSYTDKKGNVVHPGDYVDYEGNVLPFEERVPEFDQEKGTFKVRRETWEDFVREAEERNNQLRKKLGRELKPDEIILPEEAFIIATTETQEKISMGWAGSYGQGLDEEFETLKRLQKMKEFYESLEKDLPEEEKWKILRQKDELTGRGLGSLVPSGEKMLPSEFFDLAIKKTKRSIMDHKEMVSGQMQQAEEQRIMRDHAVSAEKYARWQSRKSYVELGIHAMEQTAEKNLAKPVFVAPENIFPEMGYGSHPEELIELVQTARKGMVQALTQRWVPHPEQRKDASGNVLMVENPHFRPDMSVDDARKKSESHIRATLDTQHLGMWWKHFEQKPGETEHQKRDRFNKWYLEEVKKMQEANILGNIHVVDSLGGGHHHLPAGQGNLPIKTALEYLKEKGYTYGMVSEAFEEPGRILTKTWEHFGSPIYNLNAGPIRPGGGGFGGPARWSDVHHSYFGRTYPPNYIFGSYSPSNEWTLWSQVPME